jgi:activating signal cointegrator 1
MTLDAISIWQPHASLFFIGPKRYETRSWPAPARLIGQRIAIHASKPTDELIELAEYVQDRHAGCRPVESLERFVLTLRSGGISRLSELPLGCIIGTVLLAASVPAETVTDGEGFGEFRPGLHAWRMIDPVRLHTPIPYRGRPGIFTIDDLPADALAV